MPTTSALLPGQDRIVDLFTLTLLASTSRVWRAIISSSLVGMTQAAVRLAAVLMRGPPRALAVGVELDAEPGRARQTRARIGAACSPMPAVKTMASSPPRAAASEPSSRPMR